MELIKGQKAELSKNSPGLNKLILGIGWNADPAIDLDASAFLLGVDGMVLKEEDFIFYGNPSDSNKAVTYNNNSTICVGHSDKQQIIVDLSNVPTDIDKIAVTITIYEAEQRQQNFGQVSELYLHIVDEDKEAELFFFDLTLGLSIENALVVGEIYRNKEYWKFNATGSGFHGGLASLCTNFGVKVKEIQTPDLPEPIIDQVKPIVSPTITQSRQNFAQERTINFTRIELTNKDESINLEVKSGNLGEILVNFNWNQTKGSGGGFLKSILGINKNIELELGCMYELKSTHKGVVQALGNAFGDLQAPPYISLDKDDNTVTTGENLRINGNHISDFKRILVYTYFYEGSVNWVNADGVVTIKQTGGPDIVVRLDEYDLRKTMCAIALLENVNDQTFSIKRLVQFFNGHREMDKAFAWDLQWTKGRKDK